MINLQGYWYSPGYIIHMDAELVNLFGQDVIDKDTQNFRKVGEMKCTAIMLFALHRVFKHHFLMQAAKDEFPDVYTLYQEEVPGKLVDTKYQTVEVVTYDLHSAGDVADFILETKLMNPKKSYNEETIILCYIRKAGTYINFTSLYEKLKSSKFRPTRVFIIGNKMRYENIFQLTQVWPIIHHEFIDYVKEAKTYPRPHRHIFKKGAPKKIETKTGPSLPIDPFVPFDIDEEKVKKKYKKE